MTTSAIPIKKPIRSALAYGVHLFTATGAVWGFLTLLAIWEQNIKLAIIYIIVAMFVDGFDGMLARWVDVKTYAKGFDGAMLDNIIDYITYVVVASLLLIRVPNILPAGFEMAGALSILLTSGYWFAQVDAKTDDHFFKGFPCYWNFLVLYMMVLKLNPWINLAVLVICNILIFVPVKYVYPSRTVRLRRLTLVLSYIYGAVGVWALLQYPDVPRWAIWASFIYVAYYVMLSLLPRLGATESSMRIEIVTKADEELLEAFQRLIPQLTKNPVRLSRDEITALVKSTCSTLLVARADDDSIVGVLSLTVYRVPTGIRSIIEDVIVDEAARGQGTGEALTRRALEIAKEAGAAHVTLTSNPRREAANRLYQRMGFIRRETNAYIYKF